MNRWGGFILRCQDVYAPLGIENMRYSVIFMPYDSYIMLLLDIHRICAEKGIGRPITFLKGLGFNPSVITEMLSRRRTRLNYAQIEQLCLALRCTPNDLFSWEPGEGADAAQPMQALVRNKPGIAELLHALPTEKIEELRGLMVKMRDGA